ncbi:MAG: hypothetical protein R2692_07620 [Microbacterium sp.]
MQAENSAAYLSSLAAGEPLTVETTPTIADGIAVARSGRPDLSRPSSGSAGRRGRRSATTTSRVLC